MSLPYRLAAGAVVAAVVFALPQQSLADSEDGQPHDNSYDYDDEYREPPPDEPATDPADPDTPTEPDLPVEQADYEPPPPPRCIDQDVTISDYRQEDQYMKWTGRSNRPDDPDAYAVERMCRDMDEPCETIDECDYTRSEGWEWRVPGQDPPPGEPQGQGPADPEAVAQDLYARVMGRLPEPRVVANPVLERAAVVDLPSFVSVSNWGTFRDGDCDENGLLCVQVVAEPTGIIYDPGEPGAAAGECEGPGQPYQPGIAADADEQASWPETCTYTYTQRSGEDGGPDAWPAQVSIVWDVVGVSNLQPEPEALGERASTTGFPREVNEVQSVVTD